MTLLKKTLTYDMLLFIELVRVYNTGSRDTHNNYIIGIYISKLINLEIKRN